MTRLEFFLKRLEFTQETFGEQLGVTAVSVGRYCRPIGDEMHRQPRKSISTRMSGLTHGLIHAGNHADEITEAEADAMMTEYRARAAASTGGEVGA